VREAAAAGRGDFHRRVDEDAGDLPDDHDENEQRQSIHQRQEDDI
jgi:hypothetical protein